MWVARLERWLLELAVAWYVPRRCTVRCGSDWVREMVQRRRPLCEALEAEDTRAADVAIECPASAARLHIVRGILPRVSGEPLSYWLGYDTHREDYTAEMFGDITRSYDWATKTMSLYQDPAWKRELVAGVRAGRCVDLGCGTGDVLCLLPPSVTQRVGIDLCKNMLRVAHRRLPDATWVQQSAAQPFGETHYIFAGYLFRNVPDKDAVLANCHKCLRPEGELRVLDMFRPPRAVALRMGIVTAWCTLQDIMYGHTNGGYRYISTSIVNFETAAEFCQRAQRHGFTVVRCQARMFGAAHVVVLRKAAVAS